MGTSTNYLVTIMQVPTVGSHAGITITAPMPDTFMYDAQSNFEAPYAKGLTGDGPVTNILAAIGYRATMQFLTANLWTGSQDSILTLEMEFQTESDPVLDVRAPILNLLKLATPGSDPNTGVLTSPGPSFNLTGSNVLAVGADAIDNLGTTGAALSGVTKVANVISSSMRNLATTSTSGTNASVAATNPSAATMTTGAYWTAKMKNVISIKLGNYCYFDNVVITNVQQTFASNFDTLTGWPHHVKVTVQFKPTFMVVTQDLENIFINPNGQSAPSTSGYNVSAPSAFGQSTSSGGLFSLN